MFKFVLLISLFTTYMFSSVVLKSQASFTKNEAFLFSYEVSGSNVKFPEIKNIGTYEVFSRGSSSKFYYVNGKSSRQIIKQYMIYPKADFTIPSFIFEFDGEEVKSEKKLIKKLKISKSKYKNFDLSMSTKSKNIYVGEEVLLKIQFKYKKDLQLVDLSLEKPDFSNFWFKQLDKKNAQYEENNYIVQDIYFIVFAQKEGSLVIPPIKVNLQVLDPYSNSFSFMSNSGQNIKIYSNDLKFNVKALPQGISLYGDFKLNSSISTNEIKEGEALSYKINISAYGNIDDLEDIKLDINNATIYANKADLKNSIKDSLYYGTYSKSFSIISDEDFIIPSYTLKYFDKNTKSIKIIKTKEYQIKVIKNKKNNVDNVILQKNKNNKAEQVNIIKEKIIYKNDYKFNILYFILGSIFTFILIKIFKYKNTHKKVVETKLLKLVKLSNSKNVLLTLLSKYINKNIQLDEKIFIFEKSDEKDFKNEKKEIMLLIKYLEKEGKL